MLFSIKTPHKKCYFRLNPRMKSVNLYILKSTRITKPGMPLIAYIEMSAFKIYMLDIGLLSARGDLDAKVLLEGNQVFEEFKGALTEQFVAQELTASGVNLYYYSKEHSSGELDFMIQRGVHIIPVEVKAAENLQAKSLREYCKKYKPEIAVRTSMSEYRKQAATYSTLRNCRKITCADCVGYFFECAGQKT